MRAQFRYQRPTVSRRSVKVFRRLDELGVELIDISLRKPSLDEVFMHLTVPTVTT